VGQWSEQSTNWFWSFAIGPTHWMPLPEPPMIKERSPSTASLLNPA
jgi:uncharacterized protein DUF551